MQATTTGQAPRYSAREALANALRAYEAAVQTRRQNEAQAAASRDAAIRQARDAEARAQQQATAGRTGGLDQARRLIFEVDRLSDQADRELAALELAPPIIQQVTIPYAHGGSAMQGLSDQYNAVRDASLALTREGDELRRVRGTLLVRIRRAVHLPP